MATLANNSSGNFTTAATWSLVDATSYLNSEASNSASVVSYTSSSAFTPGAITIDGIGIKILSINNITGTVSVRLANAGVAVAGTTVTINVSDIAAVPSTISSWVFFKFANPLTLTAATAYTLQVLTSSGASVNFYRDATVNNWTRYLRTTTNQSPTTADTLFIVGDYSSVGVNNTFTVTMNNTTSTIFGTTEVCNKGILNYGTLASTTYSLRLAANLYISAGILQIGTSGAPIPSTSTATLEFVVASNNQYGLIIRSTGTLITYGNNKTGRAYLAADVAAAATSITTDLSTGWTTGDSIVIASTSLTQAESELITLPGNASGTSVPITAAAYAHSATAPYIGEVINITRNVKIIGQSIALQSYISLPSTSTISINYTEFAFLNNITATGSLNSISVVGSSFRNFEATASNALVLGTSVSPVVSDCVFYRVYNNAISTTGTLVNITNCWGIYSLGTGTQFFAISATSGTVSGLTAVSCNATTWGFGVTSSTDPSLLSVSNLVTHSSPGYAGGYFSGTSTINGALLTISNIIVWRCAAGIQMAANNAAIDNFTCYANSSTGVYFTSAFSYYVLIKNSNFYGGVSPVQQSGLSFFTSSSNIFLENCTFGSPSVHSLSDIRVNGGKVGVSCFLRNCILSTSTQVGLVSAMSYDSFIASSKHNGVANAYSMYKHTGTITRDAVIYDTSPASTRLTPSTSGSVEKLKTQPKTIIIPSGKALKVTVAVRTSVSGDGAIYNGASPRLVLQKNYALGVTSDTVLATATVASSGAFENISGTTPVATDNGAYSVYVDCSGTVGFTNCDTWKVEIV